MPIPRGATVGDIIREILRSWRETRRIGNIRPKNLKHAVRIARAIAMRRLREGKAKRA